MPSCGLLAANVTSSAQRPLEITRFLNLVGNKPEPLPGIGNYGWSWIKGNQGQTVTLDCNVNNQISAEVISKSCKTFNEQLKNRQNVNPSQLSQIKLFVTKLIDQFSKISNSNQNGIGTLKNIGLLSLSGVFLLNSNSNPFVLFVDYGWRSNGISQDGIDDITKWIHQGHHLAIAQGVYPPDYSEKKALARFICLILTSDLQQAKNPMAFSHCNVAGKEIWAKLLKAQDSELSVSDLDIDIGPLFSLEVKKIPLVPIVGGSFVVLSLAIVLYIYAFVPPGNGTGTTPPKPPEIVGNVVTAQINLNGLPAGSVKIEDLDFKGCSPFENAKVEVVDGKASLKVIINKGSEQVYTVALKISDPSSLIQLKNLQAISLVAEKMFEKNFLLNRFEAIEMLKKGLLDNPKAKDAPGGSEFVSWVVTRTKQE
jgi:hypothetical protein